jgi:ABC-type sugar transport system substrate-binding protein
MARRKALVIALVALVAVLVAGIGATTGSAKRDQTVSIAFIPPVIANPIIKAMNDAMKLKAEDLGMRFSTVGGQYDPKAQIVAVDAAVQRGYDGLAIWPLDPKGIQPSLDKVRKSGMKLIVIETPGVKPYMTNMDQQGALTARLIGTYGAKLAKQRFGSCNVGIIQGIPVVDILRIRNEGLAAAAKAQGCTILAQQINQKDNADGARPIVDAWKTKYGSRMNLILAYNDPSALGAISAVGGSFTPLITGMNGDDLAVQAVKSGALAGTASAPNVEMGEAMAQLFYNAIVRKQKVPQTVYAEPEMITPQTIGKYLSPAERLKRGPMTIQFVKKGNRTFIKATFKK